MARTTPKDIDRARRDYADAAGIPEDLFVIDQSSHGSRNLYRLHLACRRGHGAGTPVVGSTWRGLWAAEFVEAMNAAAGAMRKNRELFSEVRDHPEGSRGWCRDLVQAEEESRERSQRASEERWRRVERRRMELELKRQDVGGYRADLDLD